MATFLIISTSLATLAVGVYGFYFCYSLKKVVDEAEQSTPSLTDETSTK
jgi:hypothetical protein